MNPHWLHKALETFRVPKDLVGKVTDGAHVVPSRIYPVFRDREELPTATNLGEVIDTAVWVHMILRFMVPGILPATPR